MSRRLMKLLITGMIGALLSARANGLIAQDEPTFTEQQVIDMVTTDSDIGPSLEGMGDWRAAAYNTRNAYGIWHVQFWDSEGEDRGWVEIQPENEIIYASDTHFPMSEARHNQAEPILREFVAQSDEVRALMPRPQDYDMYIDYNSWEDAWGVYIDDSADSLYVVVSFADDEFSDPQVQDIHFYEVLSFDDWLAAMQAEVSAVAFEQVEIAQAVRDVENWHTQVERLDAGDTWVIEFMADGGVLARATVDTLRGEVLDYTIG